MAKFVELRRHTDNDDDVLSDDGLRAALVIGATLSADYELMVSSGAQRSTQTLGCFLSAMGRKVPCGVVVEAGLRSGAEDRWKDAYQEAGSAELDALRSVEFFEDEARQLGAALGHVFEELSEGGRALVVGHSPTNEVAVFGLTGHTVQPMKKGAGVLVVQENGDYRVEPLD